MKIHPKLFFLFLFLMVIGFTIGMYTIRNPQIVRCFFIDYYDFQQKDNLYYRAGTDTETLKQLKRLMLRAQKRNAAFWGGVQALPSFIYCETAADYQKFGFHTPTPAVSHLSFQSVIVLGQRGVNLDIIAHEMAHTELSARIGVLNRMLKIPVWFDEGLAMQLDYRAAYSLDSLATQTNNFADLPQVTQMTAHEFWEGTRPTIMKNYMTSKLLVSNWLKENKLSDFIAAIQNGDSFDQAYGGSLSPN